MKKVMIFVLAIVLIGGGAAGGYFFLGKDKKNEEEVKDNTVTENWNPFSTESNHLVGLPNQLLSAVNGTFIVKMDLTLNLKDEESMMKYNGESEYATHEEEKSGGHGGGGSTEEAHDSPMKIFMKSKIGTYLMGLSEQELKDKTKLEEGIRNELNTQLNLGEDFIKHVYIENLIIQ